MVLRFEFAFLIAGWEVLDIAVSDDNARFASVGGDKAVYLLLW
jgi:hypothetical protein